MEAGPTPAGTDMPPQAQDLRLYVPEYDRWTVKIMSGVEREYCYQQAPGQDYYHLIVPGEIYLQLGTEKLCLNCALRRNLVTRDRLYWQTRGR